MQNPDEIFDVVDDCDQVVGQERRCEVHRRGLKHRAVHILVFNSEGKIFLQKRSMTKDTFPGAWDSSASGHLDSGEDYDYCADRELKEELGFAPISKPKRLFKLEPCSATGQEFVWIFACKGDGPFELNAGEIERGEWFTPEQITKWMQDKPQEFANALLHLWPRVLERIQEGSLT